MAPKIWKKCVVLLRIPAYDHANPCEGLLVSPKICHFTTRSVARPSQSIVNIDASRQTVGKNVSFYFAFLRLTSPIPGKGCASRQNVSFYDALSRTTRPIHCKNRGFTQKMSFYDAFRRSTRPIHCKNRCVAPHGRKNVSFYLAFLRLTSPIPVKACASRRQGKTLPRVQSLDQANPL